MTSLPGSPPEAAPAHRGLRVALLAYRGDPYCGGQGVYVRNLSRELVRLGHHVEVFAGQPYPLLDEGVLLHPLPSLDLYRQPDPFRVPRLQEFRDLIDVWEFAHMCTAGFPEPLTFSLRAARALRVRRGEFDVVHDNQTLGWGMLDIARRFPVVTTIHHPITVDRRVDLAATPLRRQLPLRRWYGFTAMQRRVARRLADLITVSTSSASDIHREFGIPAERIDVIPVGFDPARFMPLGVQRIPGRIVTTASADVPMKGLVHLLEAVAKLRVEREVSLVVVGKRRTGGPTDATIDRLGLRDAVEFVSGISDEALVELLNSAAVVAVPSLYEGFSLPAVEAMACGTPVVATTGGALPEVVGTDGETGRLVPPGDAEALRAAIAAILDDPAAAARIGAAGRQRALKRFSWSATAERTVQTYLRAIGDHPC